MSFSLHNSGKFPSVLFVIALIGLSKQINVNLDMVIACSRFFVKVVRKGIRNAI